MFQVVPVFLVLRLFVLSFFFFNDTATTEIYTLSLHDALPISGERGRWSSCIWNLGFFPNDARKNCPFVAPEASVNRASPVQGLYWLLRKPRNISLFLSFTFLLTTADHQVPVH